MMYMRKGLLSHAMHLWSALRQGGLWQPAGLKRVLALVLRRSYSLMLGVPIHQWHVRGGKEQNKMNQWMVHKGTDTGRNRSLL